jgi:hypothetical protein
MLQFGTEAEKTTQPWQSLGAHYRLKAHTGGAIVVSGKHTALATAINRSCSTRQTLHGM